MWLVAVFTVHGLDKQYTHHPLHLTMNQSSPWASRAVTEAARLWKIGCTREAGAHMDGNGGMVVYDEGDVRGDVEHTHGHLVNGEVVYGIDELHRHRHRRQLRRQLRHVCEQGPRQSSGGADRQQCFRPRFRFVGGGWYEPIYNKNEGRSSSTLAPNEGGGQRAGLLDG